MVITQENPSTRAIDDQALLKACAQTADREAFTQLVNRHIHFVHGVALRSLGRNSSRADDVSQAVFTILWKKAGTIRGSALPSWLHQTTLYAVANAKKMQARREHHERAAALNRPEAVMRDEPADSLLPVLDEAIASLREKDRVVILARHFEGVSIDEVAKRIGANPEAAQKRLERAIKNLGEFFAKQSLPSTLGAVTATLVASGNHKASASLASSVSDGVTSNTSTALVKGTLTMMNQIKIRRVIFIASLALLTGVVGAAGAWQATHGHSEVTQQPVQKPLATEPPTTAHARADDDRVAIRGTWEFVSVANRGRIAPDDQLKDVVCVFTETEMRMSFAGQVKETGKYTLDTTTDPKKLDLRDNDNPQRLVPGIYDLQGDTLRIYFDDRNLKRPTQIPQDLKKAASKLYVLRRQVAK